MRFCNIEMSRRKRLGTGIGCGLVCLIGMVLVAGAARAGQQAGQSGTAQKAPEASHEAAPGAPGGGQVSGQPEGKQNAVLSREERNRQIVEDSARLLKLATDLKIAVDNTTMDTLSIGVIRKADEIEKLAKNTRDKVKQSQDSASSKKVIAP